MDRCKLRYLFELKEYNFIMHYFEKRNIASLKLNLLRVLTSGISSISVLGFASSSCYALPINTSSLVSESPKEVIDQVWQIVYRDYLDSSGTYEPNEWLNLRSKLLGVKYADTTDSYEAIRGMLAILEDPYTRFMDPKEFKEMRIDTSGELSGVGIQLSLDKKTNDLVVISPIEGTPAFKAGIKPKDVIVSIDAQPTQGMSIDNAVKLIRGRKGTKVILGVQRNDKLIKIHLVRDKIEIKAVDSQLNQTRSGIKFGYIRLKQFNANSVREMRNVINNLEAKNALGYILDLRSNPGGLLEASIEIARFWLDKGVIVSTETRDGIKDVRRANGRALTSRPVVVLVNSGSASASEILSGAIQENNRGILVGEKTYGKGLVQSVRALPDGSGLTVTIAKYLTPKGRDIHRHGIKPDIQSELSEKNAMNFTINDLATAKDTQYIVAETELIRVIMRSQLNTTYQLNTSNINFALN